MDDRDAPGPLKDLGDRIDKAYGGRDGSGKPADGRSAASNRALAMGLRIGLELVVAVIVGVGIGFLVDRWLGTRPWGTVVCFFLGVAAGMVNVYRAVTGAGMAAGYRQDAPPAAGRAGRKADDWDED